MSLNSLPAVVAILQARVDLINIVNLGWANQMEMDSNDFFLVCRLGGFPGTTIVGQKQN